MQIKSPCAHFVVNSTTAAWKQPLASKHRQTLKQQVRPRTLCLQGGEQLPCQQHLPSTGLPSGTQQTHHIIFSCPCSIFSFFQHRLLWRLWCRFAAAAAACKLLLLSCSCFMKAILSHEHHAAKALALQPCSALILCSCSRVTQAAVVAAATLRLLVAAAAENVLLRIEGSQVAIGMGKPQGQAGSCQGRAGRLRQLVIPRGESAASVTKCDT